MSADDAVLVLYVGTDDGVRVVDATGADATVAAAGLHGESVREMAVHPDDPGVAYVACGLRGWGLHRTTDGGETFETLGFEDRWVWGVTLDPTDPDVVYAGTEPPMLHRSDDGGATWTALESIEDVPSRDRWTFFHDPFGAGHVHGLAVHPDRPGRLFAGVEIGGVVYSHDGGEMWRDALAGHDVHRLAVDPADPNRVFAAAGEGLFVSDDAGHDWRPIEQFRDQYVRQVVFAPDDPGTAYATGTDSGGTRDSHLYASADGGETWERRATFGTTGVSGKLGLAVHPDDGDRLVHADDADAETSRLHASDDGGRTWRTLGVEVPTVRCVEAVT